MKRWLALALVAAFAAACSDRPAPTQPGGPSFLDVPQGQSHVHVMPLKAQAFGLGAAKPGRGGSNGGPAIFYHARPNFHHNIAAPPPCTHTPAIPPLPPRRT